MSATKKRNHLDNWDNYDPDVELRTEIWHTIYQETQGSPSQMVCASKEGRVLLVGRPVKF